LHRWLSTYFFAACEGLLIVVSRLVKNMTIGEDVLVKYSVVEGELGHSDVVALIKERVQDSGKPLRVVVADSSYGQNKRDWDVVWSSEFSKNISVPQEVACNLDKVVFMWFLSDQPFPEALDAIRDFNACLQYLILYRSKRGVPTTGSRWKNDGEFIFVVYSMTLKELVSYDREDPLRWSTNPKFNLGPLFKHEGKVLNSSQKPIALLRRLLYIGLPAEDSGTILDLTCGTGTTAVSLPWLNFCCLVTLVSVNNWT
jgi:hypothetical protein